MQFSACVFENYEVGNPNQTCCSKERYLGRGTNLEEQGGEQGKTPPLG